MPKLTNDPAPQISELQAATGTGNEGIYTDFCTDSVPLELDNGEYRITAEFEDSIQRISILPITSLESSLVDSNNAVSFTNGMWYFLVE